MRFELSLQQVELGLNSLIAPGNIELCLFVTAKEHIEKGRILSAVGGSTTESRGKAAVVYAAGGAINPTILP